MVELYIYHKDNKILQIGPKQDGPEGLEMEVLTFEQVPTKEQIEEKFYEIKGE